MDSKQVHDEIICPTLEYLGAPYDSPSAVNLLLGTAAKESQMGHYLKQINGIAVSMYQFERITFDDMHMRFLNLNVNLELKQKVHDLLSQRNQYSDGFNEAKVNPCYATAICRLIYFYKTTEPLPAPDDIAGLARYWKTYYNTIEGAGTEAEFIQEYHYYVKF